MSYRPVQPWWWALLIRLGAPWTQHLLVCRRRGLDLKSGLITQSGRGSTLLTIVYCVGGHLTKGSGLHTVEFFLVTQVLEGLFNGDWTLKMLPICSRIRSKAVWGCSWDLFLGKFIIYWNPTCYPKTRSSKACTGTASISKQRCAAAQG